MAPKADPTSDEKNTTSTSSRKRPSRSGSTESGQSPQRKPAAPIEAPATPEVPAAVAAPAPTTGGKPTIPTGPIFFTGVPGFIGKRLALRVLHDNPGHRGYFLVEPRMMDVARQWADEVAASDPALASRLELVEGDITKADCAIEATALERILAETGQIFHLAAVYDLAMPRQLGVRVNVEGTRNVLDLAARMPGLKRLSYISTCFVAGRRKGVVMEADLDAGQLFKNYYEETKFLAEVEVRRRMSELPIAIFRPAIVVGDSKTGETDKFDGPYFAFRAMLLGLLFVKPGALRAYSNVVPVDFTVDAIATISRLQAVDGQTFHLVDPETPRNWQVVELAADRLGIAPPMARVPASLFKLVLSARPISQRLGIPAQVLDYFNHMVIFDSRNTQRALAGTGVSCPPFAGYINTLIAYYRAHAELPWSVV